MLQPDTVDIEGVRGKSLDEIAHRREDEHQLLFGMRHLDGVVGHLRRKHGVVDKIVIFECDAIVAKLVAEDQTEGFHLAEFGLAPNLAMARHACVHGRRGNIASMNISRSFNARAFTRRCSSTPGMIGDIFSDHTGETGALPAFAAICAA